MQCFSIAGMCSCESAVHCRVEGTLLAWRVSLMGYCAVCVFHLVVSIPPCSRPSVEIYLKERFMASCVKKQAHSEMPAAPVIVSTDFTHPFVASTFKSSNSSMP